MGETINLVNNFKEEKVIFDCGEFNNVNINYFSTKYFGKTPSTLKYINNDSYIIINCSGLFDIPIDDKKIHL